MKKAVATILIVVVLISCMSLSAFAETGVPFDISSRLYIEEASVRVKSKSSATTVVDKWVESNSITYAYNPNMPYAIDGNTVAYYMNNRFGNDVLETYPSTDYQLMGFKIDYRAYNDQIVTDPGYYMMITIAGDDTTTVGSFMGAVDLYFNGCIYDTFGNEYVSRTSPQFYPNNPNRWYATLLFRLGDGEPCEVRRILLESNMPSTLYGSMYYDVNIAFVAAMYPTEAQRILEEQLQAIDDAANAITSNQDANTDKIIANDDANTDKITDSVGDAADDITANQDANTDKIIENENQNHEDLKNGWEAPGDGDPGGDVDDLTDKMGDADSAALGGKSDADIQNEVGGLLSDDNLPGIASSGMVSNLFDKLLKAFGNEYQALLMLSLILGLAAFLVGRQYRARGD